MKRTILPLAIVAAALAFNPATAQIAAKKNVTLEEVNKHISALAQKENDESKKELAFEAKALVASKNEQFVSFGARVFEYLGNTEAAEQAQKSIVKKFPKGIKARQEAFNTIFNDKDASLATVEKKHKEWLKKFPATNFDEKNQEIYNQALFQLATLSFENGATQQGNAYVAQLEKSPNFANYAIGISRSLIKGNKYQDALPVLENAYEKATNDQSRQGKYMAGQIAPIYAATLSKTNQTDKAIAILELLSVSTPLSPESTEILAEGYTQQGKSLDAFLLVSNFIKSNGQNDVLSKRLEALYNHLNNNKGDYSAYAADLKRQTEEATLAKYKSEMIKKDAPEFSLVNMKGETVSLKDLKGKVIVLDFWATWCGPCKISFPGMQAAVNKYKDDKDVEFLFIDTWQREENYKEVVEKFITDNKYTFNVLFDEMKDRDKATTTAYGVKGIPHKVVIDKEGFIRFESSGGSADVEKIVNEMSAKIELARKG